MNKQFFLFILAVFYASFVMAGSGILQTYIVLDENGAGDSFYAGGENENNSTSFIDLSFSPTSSLTLKGGEVKTFKNSGSDVMSADMNYRIYLEGSTPPSFQSIGLPFNSDLGGGEQKWQLTSANIDLKQVINNLGTGPGNYILEVYWHAASSDGDHYDSIPGDDYSATIVASSSFLPISLVKIEAKNNFNHNLLTWQTATETNNSHFNIERSNDSKTWSTIGKTEGKGTTNQQQSYTFEDNKPFNGRNYYRLKQVDFDDTFSYSPIVVINNKKIGVNVFPNPVHDYFDVLITDVRQEENYTLFLMNAQGQLVKKVVFDRLSTKIETDGLPDGLYLANVRDARGNILFVQQLTLLGK